jgi:hypothetical protein
MSFSTRVAAFVVVAGGAAVAWCAAAEAGATPKAAATFGAPVVVELFSSEGCSSCPSAEAFLRQFGARRPVDAAPVLALEYHVDYWDYLGWKDPFSRHEFTERQEDYARAFGDGRVYTPEIVVQGKLALERRSARSLEEHVRREASAPVARVAVGTDGGWVTVHVERSGANRSGEPEDVALVVTESDLRSEVRAGENRGETLAHAPVVRRLTTLGEMHRGTFDAKVRAEFEPSWRREHVRFVAFVQGRSSRHIFGAGYR